ncbi:ABC-three component system protein [uncultured Paraglaciecola sp.]|uniref:ABC-three component system protein n=1 Tax=uncultured Paraglaciecola sp. TaxID=1765024 RepID=UPI002607C92A|nr:ABC-three component system protein [uncultured Paraglaciecola sp.]
MIINNFDATSSLLGYIYQIRYGLLLSLKKMREVDDPDDYFVSIETIDDIAFEKSGTPEELLQTKYHSNPGNITDKSPDIWKTIRVWIEAYKNKHLDFGKASLFLVTTEQIVADTLADFLSNSKDRDIGKAHKLMCTIVEDNPSQKNKHAFKLFSSLSETEQKNLCEAIFVLDKSETLVEIEKHLENNLRGYANSAQLKTFLNRLEGKWFSIAISALETGDGRVNLGQVVNIIDDLREQFLSINLPDDYSTAEVDVASLIQQSHNFIEQMKMFGAGERLIKKAVLDFFRASEQKSRWASDGLLNPGELVNYLRKLKEEWEFNIGLVETEITIEDEISKKKLALEVFKKCQNEGTIPIRPHFSESYLARGSYHHLADELVIGWHPDFEQLLATKSKSEVA